MYRRGDEPWMGRSVRRIFRDYLRRERPEGNARASAQVQDVEPLGGRDDDPMDGGGLHECQHGTEGGGTEDGGGHVALRVATDADTRSTPIPGPHAGAGDDRLTLRSSCAGPELHVCDKSDGASGCV